MSTNKTILVTGGAGFIGSALVRHLIKNTSHKVINLDKLTYASNLQALKSVSNSPRYIFERADICNGTRLSRILNEHKPDAVIHLAAESHVDRSIDKPAEFIQTNIIGTYTLLDRITSYWSALTGNKHSNFKLLHVSTDEVYGDLPHPDSVKDEASPLPLFTEKSPYAPSSPYSASKASADHIVRAWNRTYGIPTIISNCSNNYGPYQNCEKLIPLMICNAIMRKPLPIYGSGNQIRDWLHVDDHVEALCTVLNKGKIGQTYNIGGNSELRNIDVVNRICDIVDQYVGMPDNVPSRSLITYVADRPGHDLRYAINSNKIRTELGWQPKISFDYGLKETVLWFANNMPNHLKSS